ncbi:uncharacterized protein LOC143469523 [Clavelina lepadiformis]|uniref:uncharacterized protein LOC143469523 n=1 Tax=Clavelina lepadiformis TaxID=159417 RepID=UPI0040435D62
MADILRGVRTILASETNEREFRLEFPVPFTSAPQVLAEINAIGDSFATFAVNSITPDDQGFNFIVKRTDQPTLGWDEHPSLNWQATGKEVKLASPKNSGSHKVGSSPNASKTLRVNFPIPLSRTPKIVAWVRGAFRLQQTFSVSKIQSDVNGFSCTVTRTDAQAGWEQNPVLRYSVFVGTTSSLCILT